MNKHQYLSFEVTQEDIDNGEQFKAMCCPIALAVKRATKSEVVLVLNTFVGICINDGDHKYSTKGPVEKFIRDFDAGEEVKPQSFILENSLYEKA